MNPVDLIQVLVSGVALGGVYTLIGKGMFITYRTTQTLNFGQGDLLAVAAYLALTLATAGAPAPVVLVGSVAAVALLGMVVERVAVRPFQDRPHAAGALAWILTTFGFGLILQNMLVSVWGKSKQYSPPLFSTKADSLVTLAEVRFYREELAVALASLVIVGLFYLALFRSRWGKQVAAVAFDKATSALLGIDVKRTVVSSYVLMAMLAAISGVLIGPIVTIQPHIGLLFLVKGFAVVSVGGFTNPIGVLVAGIAFGVVEGFANYFDSLFGDLYAYVFVFFILIFRPTGLFGERHQGVR
ncbi:MAG: branched-chain amino acid ABC transporter permease [Alphaproteobacteria bacterium]|nr:branched-chain amino acid ABC transporter permease [Alphaproteobacteria bacterium]